MMQTPFHIKISGVFLILVALLISCSSPTLPEETKYLSEAQRWDGVTKIAVMPPENWTTALHLEKVTWFRAVINSILQQKGYATIEPVEVNTILNDQLYISDAGQLRMYSPQELGQIFKCDAILFWEIVKYTLECISLRFRLIKASDGQDLWRSGTRDYIEDIPIANVPISIALQERDVAIAIGKALDDFPKKK